MLDTSIYRYLLSPEDGDGQGGLACCDSWGRKESEMTEQLNKNKIDSETFY